jgi:hypothetical protein
MKDEEGSVTIEAALVVPVVMIIVISTLYFSFYMHDRVILTSECEYVYQNWNNGNISEDSIVSETKKDAGSKLIVIKNINVSVDTSKKFVMTLSGKLNLPFNALITLLGEEKVSVSYTRKPQVCDTDLYKIRAAKEIISNKDTEE